MMKRILSLVLVFGLIIVLAMPVKVYAAEDNLVELLEYGTVNNSGSNMFQFSTSVTVEIDVPMYTNLRYIDLLFIAHDGTAPTKVCVYYNGNNQNLTVQQISQDVYRAYGNIGGYFDSIFLSFYASGTQYYTIQSCKVSSLKTTFFDCATNFKVQILGTYYTGKVGVLFESPDFDNSSGYLSTVPYQAEIEVTDAIKYDSVNLQFATTYLSINSIRCTYGNITVPFTVNFIDIESNETYTYYFSNTGEEFSLHTYGKYIGSIEVDLTGIDRAAKSNLLVFFNGDGVSYGFRVNVSSVMGTVYFADTSDATWWQRFTNFMTDLFGEGKGQDLVDDLNQSSDSISQGASDIHSFEQSQQVVLDSAFPAIQSAVSFTSFSAALFFVQRYANLTVSGISKYMVVFTLPLFLGLFFYLCSRVPGITRWKPRPPQKKGGKSP